MKPSELKLIIKEACREAFKEELKEILLEAIKSQKSQVKETNNFIPSRSNNSVKEAYNEIMRGMTGNSMEFNTSNQQSLGPIPTNTMGEGTSLPSGEVGLDLIMKLSNPNGI